MKQSKEKGTRNMDKRQTAGKTSLTLPLSFLLVAGSLCLFLIGCTHTSSARLQSEDESDRDKDAEVELIRDVTASVENAEPIPVGGIGLVVGLDGTGGGAPPGGYRKMLEADLLKRRVPNVKQVLASPTTSLVVVSAIIPAGAQKDDLLDVEIKLPRESKTTSLRGGRLLETILYNYGTKKGLDPDYAGPDSMLLGHPVARAGGPLVAGFGDGDLGNFREARIWGGGRSVIDRPFYLILSEGKQQARVAQAVADAVNAAFHGAVRGPATDVAVAKTKSVVYLGVPSQYRLNLPRYLRVVRLTPLWDTPEKRIAYRRRLEKQLMDPAHTVTAALRLEALGKDSEPTLKRGLTSEHPLVRFCSAEALAYLGCASCGEELARLIQQQPVLRAFSLTALASLDEPISHVELRRLLTSSSAETRYGAFRALRALDERDEVLQGEFLNDSFWLHRVAPDSPALVHISTTKRAEIVLFGQDAYLIPPFPILAGEFTITAARDDTRCTIKRVSVRHGRSERQCSLKLEEVLKTLSDLGGSYAEAIELLRRADYLQCLTCKVAVDALPQATSVYDLAKAGAGDPELLQTHPEILDAKADFGATPNLFDKGSSNHSSSRTDKNAPAESRDGKLKASNTSLDRDILSQ
jgi:hypothetical protein